MRGKRERTKTVKYIWSGLLFLAVSGILTLIARISLSFSEWYSTYIYKGLVSVIGRLFGKVPFSFVELSLYVVIFLMIGTGIMLFVFVINCGINYHRESFSEKSGLKIQTYSVKDLQATCQWLTEEVNRLSTQVERTENGELQLPEEIRQEAVRSMQALGRQYPALQGYYPNPKPVLVSEILSYQKLMGIYAPFTIEANYNQDMPSYDFPFTMCHELSHLRGFMQEEEANFISFLACRESDMTEFQYSGTLSAWEYAMNALYRADPKVWQEVREGLSKAAEPDLRADDQFWSEYDGSVAEVANMVNDTYLKANGQKQGVKSYGKMTDLLVAYDQSL